MGEIPRWTVDQLAQEHGLPVSTLRLYQTRGLLPPPRKEGRVGYYDEDHRRRLRLIAQLQDRGFSLAAIRELLDGLAAGQSLHAVLGLADGPSTWVPDEPVRMALVDLLARLPGVEPTPELFERISRLGLVDLADDGDVVVHRPAFLDIGARLVAMGVPVETVLDEYEHLTGLTDDIATRFTEVFRRRFWSEFEDEGLPGDRIPGLIASLEELGPLAEAVVLVTLRHSLQSAATTFLDEQAARLGIDLPQVGAGTVGAEGLEPPTPSL